MKSVKIILTPIHKKDYDKESKTFTISEVGVQFSMNYTLINPTTGGKKEFELSHSTGSEFDPDTEWIYESKDGFTLKIVQDYKITKEREAHYTYHKMRK